MMPVIEYCGSFLTNKAFESNVKQEVELHVRSESKPIFCRARPVLLRMKDAMKVELKRLVDTGVITKVYSSNWASPTLNVLKQNGCVRICGDFSAIVNKFLNPVHTPLPTVDDVISQVGEAKYFSKIDLTNAFRQLPLTEVSKVLTTINTTDGLYSYNYLPFELCASPGIFQAFVTQIVAEIENVIVYQDDALVLTPTVRSHVRVLKQLLNILQKVGIKINLNKSNFFADSVSYLGYVFDAKGVHPNFEKVRAIVDDPCPSSLKQVQAFLGFYNYYSSFIEDYANIVSPLYALLKKNTKFHLGVVQQTSFKTIKDRLLSSSFLKFLTQIVKRYWRLIAAVTALQVFCCKDQIVQSPGYQCNLHLDL